MASDFPKRITSGWIATATPMDCNLPRLQKTHPQVIWEKTLSGSDWIHAINIMAEFTNSPPPFRYLRLQKKAALIFIGKTGMDFFSPPGKIWPANRSVETWMLSHIRPNSPRLRHPIHTSRSWHRWWWNVFNFRGVLFLPPFRWSKMVVKMERNSYIQNRGPKYQLTGRIFI